MEKILTKIKTYRNQRLEQVRNSEQDFCSEFLNFCKSYPDSHGEIYIHPQPQPIISISLGDMHFDFIKMEDKKND